MLSKYPTRLDEEAGRQLLKASRAQLRVGAPAEAASVIQEMNAPLGPEERINAAIEEIRASVAAELRENLSKLDPSAFEKLVLQLLQAMGYGQSREDLRPVGRSGDGGIDGIISLDRLGFEKVYVQAKRWQSAVGRPEIQGFFGALAGRRAKKGVFITTASFTREARDYALQVSESLVLIDGERLTELMIDHEIGVTHRTLKQPRVNAEFFEAD